MLITAPPPAVSTIFGTLRRVITKAVVTLKRNAFSNSFSPVRRAGFGGQPPALFTRMSIRPNASRVRSIRFSSWLRSSTSVGTTSARRPNARTFSAVASSWSMERAARTTSAPASA
jgi:hypothetical protein